MEKNSSPHHSPPSSSSSSTEKAAPSSPLDEDAALLKKLGYKQELLRGMNGFSNYAVSLSIICILAGGVTSFSQGFCGVGGAAIGLGWPAVCIFSLIVAATMGQVASAFPTAGGLYHWGAILGGRGWGWGTAWFNLSGLIAVLAAIDVGAVRFVAGCLEWQLSPAEQLAAVAFVAGSQALFNHMGIRLTSRLTDFSGYWIVGVAAVVVAALAFYTQSFSWERMITFDNFSGAEGGNIWPRTESLPWLFALGFLLPAYTLTGFDASAHVAEETIGAAHNVPRAIVRSVAVSGLCGWILLVMILLAMPDVRQAASQGENAFVWTLRSVLPAGLAQTLFIGIGLAQYLCGLATVTSASRMVFAFARDGGLPCSKLLGSVSPTHRTPVFAVWTTTAAAVLLTAFVPYAAIAAVCAVLLYISYVLPIALGFWAHGRRWTNMGPWHLGPFFRPLSAMAVLGCGGLLLIGIQPPNEQALWIVGGTSVALVMIWYSFAKRNFTGPPREILNAGKMSEEKTDPKRA